LDIKPNLSNLRKGLNQLFARDVGDTSLQGTSSNV
jgi:hypothetical protein